MGSQASARNTRTIELHWDETPEEKHERVNRILERNTRPDIFCVGCGFIVSEGQSQIQTSHGTYHGLPKNCVEGHEDKDIPWWQK